jgi:hypothetical protein
MRRLQRVASSADIPAIEIDADVALDPRAVISPWPIAINT